MSPTPLTTAIFFATLFLLAALNVYDLAGGIVTISGVGSLLSGVATGIGATAAIVALDTWKKQRDAELAKKMATALYQYKLCLHRIRVPFSIPEDSQFASEEGVEIKDLNFARLLRWRRSRVMLLEVEALLAEADLHWPGVVTKAFDSVRTVETELWLAISQFDTLQSRAGSRDEALRAGQLSGEKWQDEFDQETPKRRRLTELLEDVMNEDEMHQKIDESFLGITALLRSRI